MRHPPEAFKFFWFDFFEYPDSNCFVFYYYLCFGCSFVACSSSSSKPCNFILPRCGGRRRPGGCGGVTPVGGGAGGAKIGKKTFWGPVQALFWTRFGVFWVVVVFSFFDRCVCLFRPKKLKKIVFFQRKMVYKKVLFLPKTERKKKIKHKFKKK